MQLHDTHLGQIKTVSGKIIDLRYPTTDMIDIDDIALGLSHVCRFGGQIEKFYSVAQHSVLTAILAPRQLWLPALLHDASEAYLGDVVKPLKVLIGEPYKRLEETMMRVICTKYGVDYDGMDALIKPYDRRAVELEDAYLRKQDSTELLDVFKDSPVMGVIVEALQKEQHIDKYVWGAFYLDFFNMAYYENKAAKKTA